MKYWSTQSSKLTLNCSPSRGRVVISWFFWILRTSGSEKRSVQDWPSWGKERRRSVEKTWSFIICTFAPELTVSSTTFMQMALIKFTLFSHRTSDDRVLCENVADRVKIYWLKLPSSSGILLFPVCNLNKYLSIYAIDRYHITLTVKATQNKKSGYLSRIDPDSSSAFTTSPLKPSLQIGAFEAQLTSAVIPLPESIPPHSRALQYQERNVSWGFDGFSDVEQRRKPMGINFSWLKQHKHSFWVEFPKVKMEDEQKKSGPHTQNYWSSLFKSWL